MKAITSFKYIAVAGLTGTIMACSSNPKVAEPEFEATPQALVATPEPAEIVNTPRGPSLTLNDVLFDFEQASLRPEANAAIAQATAYLIANPNQTALVEGHTDTTGDAAFNQTLSEQRSQAIKDALTSNGVSSDRIKTFGLGETQPTADNDTLPGRQANRRVEIIFEESGSGL